MWYKTGLKYLRRFTWVVFLWFMFSVGCFCAPFIAMVIPFTHDIKYLQRFIRAADRLCAAMLGFSGRQMLSTELTHDTRLAWMYNLLNEIEPGHCEESAYEEGAYCRLSDKPESYRKLGCK